MKIGISGPINPIELKEFFPQDIKLPNINKGASAVNTYVKELLRNDHKVIVFTSSVPSKLQDNLVLKGKNIEIIIVQSTPGIYLTHALSRLYMINRLKKVIKENINRIDILHAQWTYDFALASKAFENRIPVFCTVRDWCPYIITVQLGLKKIQWYLYYVIFRKVLSSKKIIFIANSEYTKEKIISEYPKKDIPIIYNPIDKELIIDDKIQEYNRPIFISIASSAKERRKNIPLLLDAYKKFHMKYPESLLKLVGGDFVLENSFMKELDKKGMLEGVELCGYKTHKDLITEIDKSTCLIHPSLEETFGNILIEGMSRGLTIIGGIDSGAVPKVLGYGRYGILCDVTKSDDILYAMEISMDHDYTERLRSKMHIYLKDNYSSDIVMKKHIQLYKTKL